MATKARAADVEGPLAFPTMSYQCKAKLLWAVLWIIPSRKAGYLGQIRGWDGEMEDHECRVLKANQSFERLSQVT